MDTSTRPRSNGNPELASPQVRHDGPNRRTLSGHFSDLAHEVVDLLRQEVELAKAEADEKIDQAKRGAAELATGGAVLAGGLLVLLAAVVLLLGLVIPYWASALIVGGITAVIGASLLGKGKQDVSARHLKPERTLTEVRRTSQMAKEHIP